MSIKRFAGADLFGSKLKNKEQVAEIKPEIIPWHNFDITNLNLLIFILSHIENIWKNIDIPPNPTEKPTKNNDIILFSIKAALFTPRETSNNE